MDYMNDPDDTKRIRRRLPQARGESHDTVEMPVQLALMIARDERAVGAFASLSDERQNEYIRRARRAVGSAEIKQVVDDIIKIG